MIILEFQGKRPEVHPEAFVAENCTLIGDVVIEKGASVWFGAVLRGDMNRITLGEGSNVQDNATVHTSAECPALIGKGVTVGHNAIVHGASVGDGCMIGMGACVMDGAVIGEGSLVAAGALVTEKTQIPERSLCVGVPAKVVKTLSPEQSAAVRKNAAHYVRLGETYRGGSAR